MFRRSIEWVINGDRRTLNPGGFCGCIEPTAADVNNRFPGHNVNGSFHTVNRRGFCAVYAGLLAGESLFHCEPSYIIRFVLFLV